MPGGFGLYGGRARAQALPVGCSDGNNNIAENGETVTCVTAAPTVIPGVATTVDDITVVIGDAMTPTTFNNAAGDGLDLNGAGAQAVTINSGSSVTGSAIGVEVRSASGSGDLTIDSTGTISGGTFGVYGRKFGTGSLVVTTGAVTANTLDGVDVINFGTGTGVLSVTATGPVIAELIGIDASNIGPGAAIVNVADVTSLNAIGVEIENFVGGDISLTASGQIRAGGGEGVRIINGANAATRVTVANVTSTAPLFEAVDVTNQAAGSTDLSITATGTISAMGPGITARNRGTGITSVTAVDVTSTTNDGIYARTYVNNTGGISVTSTGTVTSFDNGLEVTSIGTGPMTIETGAVTSANGIAIQANQNGVGAGAFTITANGRLVAQNQAIDASNSGAGSLVVSVTDVISLGGDGLLVANQATSTGDVTVTATGLVSGLSDGIDARNAGTGAITVTANTVRGTNYAGIFAANSVTAAGDVTIATTGNVEGDRYGMRIENYGSGNLTITSSGVLTAPNGDGVYAVNSGTGGLTISIADATGGDNGIELLQQQAVPGVVTMSGAVRGGRYGFYNQPGSRGGLVTITSTGSLQGDTGIAFLDGANGGAGDAASQLTVAGTLLGDARMGAGSDQVTVGSGANLGTSGLGLGAGRGVQLDGDAGAGSFIAGDLDSLVFDSWTGSIDGAQIVNFEQVSVTGGATVTFTDIVAPGTGLANENTTDGLAFRVGNGSTAAFAQSFTINGNVSNFGTLDLSAANSGLGTVLTITGNYVAASGLRIDAFLNDGGTTNRQPADSALADQLIVTGTIGGQTQVFVNNTGGPGASTDRNGNDAVDANEGLVIVQMGGTPDSEGADDGVIALSNNFVLGAADNTATNGSGRENVIAGAFAYDIYAIDPSVSQNGTWDWVLASIGLAPTVALYETFPRSMEALNGLPTLRQRVGDRFWQEPLNPAIFNYTYCTDAGSCPVGVEQRGDYAARSDTDPAPLQNAIWLRIEGAHKQVDPDFSTTGVEYDINRWQLRSGVDGVVLQRPGGRLVAGVNLSYGTSSLDTSSPLGSGSSETAGFGLGASLTWYGDNGFYADAQVQHSWYETDLTSSQARTLVTDTNGTGYALSAEIGKRIDLRDGLTVTPQAQLIYANVDADSFTDPFGAVVTLNDGDSLTGRVGVAIDSRHAWQDQRGKLQRGQVHAIANLVHAFDTETAVDVSGISLALEEEAWIGEVGIGGAFSWDDDRYAIHGELAAASSLQDFGDTYGIKGHVGFRLAW
ncbi:MAG: autotransporter outer membrane beta-barrel domain-containing protein [Pseudomonadota bacterium]